MSVTHEMTKHVLLCPAKPSSEQRSFLYFLNEGSAYTQGRMRGTSFQDTGLMGGQCGREGRP